MPITNPEKVDFVSCPHIVLNDDGFPALIEPAGLIVTVDRNHDMVFCVACTHALRDALRSELIQNTLKIERVESDDDVPH